MKGGNHLPWLAGVALTLLLGAGLYRLDTTLTRQYRQQERDQSMRRLHAISRQLSRFISHGEEFNFVARYFVSRHPGLDQDEFQQFARPFLRTAPQILSLQLARDNRVSHILPLAGNEAALGLDLRTRTREWPLIQKAIDEHRTVISDRVALIQGGQAVIVRTPIYLADNTYWGLAQYLITLDVLFNRVPELRHFHYRVHGIDGGFISGDQAPLGPEPLAVAINVPGGIWWLSAVPAAGWPGSWPYSWAVWGIGLGVWLLFLLGLRVWSVQSARRNMLALIDALGLVYYRTDEEGRFVEISQAGEDLFAGPRNSLIGHYVSEHYLLPEQRQAYLRAVPEHEIGGGEILLKDHHGKPVWALARTRRLSPGHDGAPGAVEGMLTDITSLRRAQRYFEQIFTESPVGIAMIDKEGRYTGFNRAWRDFLGYSEAELRQRSNVDVTHPDDREESARCLRRLIDGECEHYRLEKRFLHRDGRILWGDQSVTAIRSETGEVEEIIGVILDITEQKRAEYQMRIAHVVMQVTGEGIMVTDADCHIIAVNPAFCRITGYDEGESLGRKPQELLKSGKQDRDFYKVMWDALDSSGQWQGELINRRRDGSLYHQGMTINRILGVHGKVSHYVATFSDISERKYHERELEFQAQHDPLTGLPNRSLFYDRLQQAMAHSRRSGETMALLFVDLDRFKPINDELGHDAGDHVLRLVAERLRQCTRAEDTVARVGGDEFLLILSAMNHAESGREVAAKVLESMASPMRIGGRELRISASAGLVFNRGEDIDLDELIRRADQAMYQAKEAGRNCYCISGDGCYRADGHPL